MHSAQESLFRERLPGCREGARVAAWLGWHTTVRLSSASQNTGQQEGKPRRDASPPALHSSKPICFLYRAEIFLSAFDPGVGCPWGAPMLTHITGSLSTASGSLWTVSRVYFRTGRSFNANLSEPQLCAGGRAVGGMSRERGRCFS